MSAIFPNFIFTFNGSCVIAMADCKGKDTPDQAVYQENGGRFEMRGVEELKRILRDHKHQLAKEYGVKE